MAKFAIVFSTENQVDPVKPSADGSSAYEKMAIGLAYSIREHMPTVDVYCGTFTSNTLSKLAHEHFAKLNVTLVEDLVFPAIKTSADDSGSKVVNDYYKFNGFLRNFTKDYFAKKLLGQYDYLIYLDIDVLVLKPIVFDFDPTSNIMLIEPIPEWSKKLMSKYTVDTITGNMYLNWVDVLNKHNQWVFDMDYSSPAIHTDHASDTIVTNRIDASDLVKIEQHIGGYHCYKPPTVESQLYHYDSLGELGTLHLIKDTHALAYRRYTLLFEHVLNIKITNKPGHWENFRDLYS